MSTPASPSSPSGPGSPDPEPSQDLLDTEAPTQMEETQEIDTEAATQIDTEAPTQIPAEMDTTEEGLEETQVDTEAPTQLMEGSQIDSEAATQIEDSSVAIDTEAPTQLLNESGEIDAEAPTQILADETSEAPTQMEESQIDTEAPTQLIENESQSEAPTQDVVEESEAPTQVEDSSRRSRSRSHSGSRSSVARSRSSGSSRSRSRSRSKSRSRSRSSVRSRSGSPRSRGSRSRSGSPRSRGSRSRSGSVRSRSRSRSGSPRSRGSRSRSRSGSPKSRGSRSRSGSRSSSKSRSRSRSRSGSESGDDIGKAKKRVVREAFGSDNEGGSDNEEAKKKRKRIVSGGAASDASDTEENKKESKPEDGGAEEGAQQVLPDDSSDDEGVNPTDQGGVGQGEFVLDFDLMMEQKKAERRRRRKKDIDLINDNDDAIAKMIADMRLAAREDRDLNATRQPATKKISMLAMVMAQLNKADLQMAFVEANVLSVLTDWLAPMPDKSLPSIQIRKSILKLLHGLRIDDHTRLKESGIGKAVMYLYKHPRELRENKVMAGKIINNWARPIFNLSTDYKSVSKEERLERDETIAAAKRRQQEPVQDQEEALRPGDPGWCYRARVPQAAKQAYVNRPKWGSEVDISRQSRKESGRLDKYLKVATQKKKGGAANTKRAVEFSMEGRKMAL